MVGPAEKFEEFETGDAVLDRLYELRLSAGDWLPMEEMPLGLKEGESVDNDADDAPPPKDDDMKDGF